MHERSLVRALLNQVQEIRSSEGDARVIEIVVSIGDFSGVEVRLLRLAFDELKQLTPLRSTTLIVNEVQLQAQCLHCQHEFDIERFHFVCPACRGTAIDILRGEELMLESIVIEQEQRLSSNRVGFP